MALFALMGGHIELAAGAFVIAITTGLLFAKTAMARLHKPITPAQSRFAGDEDRGLRTRMKITQIEVTPVSQIVKRDLAITSAAGAHPESHYLFVAVITDEGVIGYGEATLAPAWSGENQGTAAHLISHLLAP